MGDVLVQVLLIKMSIVTNVSAAMMTKKNVAKDATKLRRDTSVHVLKDTNSVGSHVLVCDY